MRCKSLALVATLALLATPALTADEDQDARSNIDVPVAIGQTVRGIRLPHYERGSNKLNLRLNAESAERASETKFTFKGLRIEIFDESEEKPAMEVILPEAVYDRETSLLTGQADSVIRGEQFEITGRQLEFDSNTRDSRLLGPVVMILTQAE